MMKRRMSILTVLILTVCLLVNTAPAEGILNGIRGEEENRGTAFSFRNNVRWNMTSQQVQAAEGLAMVERSQGEWKVLYPQNRVEVSRFFADLVYIFYRDQLKLIMYEFDPSEPETTFQYLLKALESVYGETTAVSAEDIVGIMDLFYPGRYRTEALNRVTGWKTTDQTSVFLYYYSEKAFAILYASPDIGLTGETDCATNGL